MMDRAVVAITKNGARLAVETALRISADVYIKKEFESCAAAVKTGEPGRSSLHFVEEDFGLFTGRLLKEYSAIVFIMACGIVVRSIAPYIGNKRSDPAVLVMDEKGRFVISLLSGHLGGANRLAAEIARKTGAQPVITTATDLNGMVSFDLFAQENDCVIENPENLKFISSALVNGRTVGFYSDLAVSGRLPEGLTEITEKCETDGTEMEYAVVLSSRTGIRINAGKTLYIRPRNLILGIGCKRGTPSGEIESAVASFLAENGRSMLSVKCAATADIKKDEEGIINFCREHGLSLKPIRRDEIEKVEGDYTFSSFAKAKTGVGCVCEPCCMLAGEKTVLVCGKTVYKGITLALSEEERMYSL